MKGTLVVALLLISLAIGTGNAFAMPMFSDTNKQAVFLSPLERWMPTWNVDLYVLQLEHAGYHVDVMFNENVSIAFLRTELAKYDLIIMRTDSYDYEGYTYYCSGEPVSNPAAFASKFADEISSRELQFGVCAGFSSLFIQHNYPAHSLRGLVYFPGSVTMGLASVFLAAGAQVFIGYDCSYSLSWGRLDGLSIKLLSYLAKGYTVNEAVTQLYIYLHTGHGNTADWVSPSYIGDKDFTI